MKNFCVPSLGEPSPPSIHGQPSSGKSFKISITKQDDGGAPILEYIVKYRSVSIFWLLFSIYFLLHDESPWPQRLVRNEFIIYNEKDKC